MCNLVRNSNIASGESTAFRKNSFSLRTKIQEQLGNLSYLTTWQTSKSSELIEVGWNKWEAKLRQKVPHSKTSLSISPSNSSLRNQAKSRTFRPQSPQSVTNCLPHFNVRFTLITPNREHSPPTSTPIFLPFSRHTPAKHFRKKIKGT